MYHTINEFREDWKLESDSTIKIFSNLTDDLLHYKISPNGRSLGRLAWHIDAQIDKTVKTLGGKFHSLNDDNNFPQQVKTIIESYVSVSKSLVELLRDCEDSFLKDEVMSFGEEWTVEAVLTSLVKHQIHHRAQMTVIMRVAGLRIPGIYGPAYEDWSAMNMTPME
jgi:uncharacterized damage-inducible protein DinB